MAPLTAAAGTVLVIEDEPLIRIWLADAIEAAGYQVITVSNGDEGLRYLERTQPLKALVTDVDIPGSLNGFALAWKAHSCHPEALVLVVSGQVRPQAGDLPPGAKFFAKPIRATTLADALRE